MDSGRQFEWAVAGVVLVALVASGAAFGSGADQGDLGDGNASATVESLPTDRLHVDRGRFGTGVLYLRIPDVRVRVSDVRDRPRLVYRVRIPDLDVDETATRVLERTGSRTVALRGTDVAFDPASVARERYDATVAVRVQSFAVDRTVVAVNETVEVER